MHRTHRKSSERQAGCTFDDVIASADEAGKRIAHDCIGPAMVAGLCATDLQGTLFDVSRELLSELVEDGLTIDQAKEVVGRILLAAETEVVEMGLQAHGLTGKLQ